MSSTQITQCQINRQKEKVRTYDAKKNIPIYCMPSSKSNNTNLNTFNTGDRRDINLVEHRLKSRAEDIKARLHDVNQSHNTHQFEDIVLEYERLKVEHGKAIDRCLTKEGEVLYI